MVKEVGALCKEPGACPELQPLGCGSDTCLAPLLVPTQPPDFTHLPTPRWGLCGASPSRCWELSVLLIGLCSGKGTREEERDLGLWQKISSAEVGENPTAAWPDPVKPRRSWWWGRGGLFRACSEAKAMRLGGSGSTGPKQEVAGEQEI